MGEGQITAATTATRNQLTSTYLKATTIDTTGECWKTPFFKVALCNGIFLAAAALLDTSSQGQAPATPPPRAPTLTTATLGRWRFLQALSGQDSTYVLSQGQQRSNQSSEEVSHGGLLLGDLVKQQEYRGSG